MPQGVWPELLHLTLPARLYPSASVLVGPRRNSSSPAPLALVIGRRDMCDSC